jgi:hypothetical protein
MKTWRKYQGLLLPLLVVSAMVLWPVLTNNVSNREIVFIPATSALAILYSTVLEAILAYILSMNKAGRFGWGCWLAESPQDC